MEKIIKTQHDMLEYYNNFKYIVFFPDKKFQLYYSLRDISNDTCIDHSTISKKLNENNPCICKSKGTEYIFLITKLPRSEL
jgi:hypothetical protein